MSERPAPQKRSVGTMACLGCGGLLLLLCVGFGVASLAASRSVERRMVLLSAELDDARAARPPERAPLFHLAHEVQDGDAVDDYAALVSGAPPLLTTPEGATVEDLLDEGQPLTPIMAQSLARYGPLTRLVRSGIRRERCDWKVDLASGAAIGRLEIDPFLAAAEYMAYEAAAQPPPAAARTGLEVVAFGRDVARHDTLVSGLLGVVIQGIGVRAIARALDQGEASKEELTELLTTLDALPPLDLERGLTCERLQMQVAMARCSGHPLAPGRRWTGPTGLPAWSRIGPLFFEREMEAYADGMRELGEALKRPADERAAASRAVRARYQRYVFAGFAIPDLTATQDNVETVAVEVDLCRVLLAARLHLAETGQPPARDIDLARRLGGRLPRDPFAGAPVRWAVRDGRLRAWSVGRNLTDEDGQRGQSKDTGDVVLSTGVS